MGSMHRRASGDRRIATTDLAHDLTLVTRDAKLENQGVRRLIPILCVSGGVNDLLDEMKQCKSVRACIELALTDAYGDYEQACAWLTCIETMFGRYKRAVVIGEEVTLEGFELVNDAAIVAVCRRGKRKARVALESVEFPDASPIEARWLTAWKRFASGTH